MGSGLCVPPSQEHFLSAFVVSRGKDAESSQGHLLHRVDTRPTLPGQELQQELDNP